MKMRPNGRLYEEERQRETQQALVPTPTPTCSSPQTSISHPHEDDSKRHVDKVTICEITLLSLQHFMVAASRCVLAVLHISPALCLLNSDPVRGLLLARFLALSGITTLLQSSPLGIGLPLAYAPCLSTLGALSIGLGPTTDHCPKTTALEEMEVSQRALVISPQLGQIQGALLISSAASVVVAFVIPFLPFRSRPVFATTASLVGALMAIKPPALILAVADWPAGIAALIVIAVATIVAVRKVRKKRMRLPLPACSARKGFHLHCLPIGATSVLLTVVVMWIVCAVATSTHLISERSSLSTSSNRPDRIFGPFSFLVPSICWGVPSVDLDTIVVVLKGLAVGLVLNWGSWAAVSAATLNHEADGRLPVAWRGILVNGLSAVLAGLMGAPAPMAAGADTAGVAFFAKVAGSRAAGVIPVRVCGVLLILASIVPAISVVVCSTPVPAVIGASLLFIASSGGAGFLYLENVKLRAFNQRLLLGLALLVTVLLYYIQTWEATNLFRD